MIERPLKSEVSRAPGAVGRRAVIDVGTNSVKLLVADVDSGGRVAPVWERSEQTRLGAGFYAARRLQSGSVWRTAECVRGMVAAAGVYGAETCRVVATSVVREAVNAAELTEAIREATGLVVEIISGECEASWVYRGVASGADGGDLPLLIVDVGGGSTEVVLGRKGEILFCGSFKLGTVRWLEGNRVGDPPTELEGEACQDAVDRVIAGEVLPAVKSYLGGLGWATKLRLIGASGTATILGRLASGLDTYDPRVLDGMVLSGGRLAEMRAELWGQPLERRRCLPGMPADRADVMLPGVVVYERFAKLLGVEELSISMRGVRFGALLDEGGKEREGVGR